MSFLGSVFSNLASSILTILGILAVIISIFMFSFGGGYYALGMFILGLIFFAIAKALGKR